METRLTHKFWARFLAFILLLLTASAVMIGAVTAVTAAEDGWFYGEPSFAESWVCRLLVLSDRDGIEMAEQDGMLDSSVYVVNAEKGNLFLVLWTEDPNRRIADTRDARGASGVTQVDTHRYGYRRYDAADDQTVWEERQLDLYLRDELRPGDRYETAYRLWAQAYRNRVLILSVSAAALLLSVALYVFLLCSAGHREGVKEPVLIRQDKIPFDLYLVILLFLVFGITAILADVMQSSRELLKPPTLVLGILGYLILFISLSMTTAARLKVGKWWRNTLIFRLLHGLVRLLRVLPMVWQAALIYLGFCVLGFFLACILFGDWGSSANFAFFALALLFLGGLALVCIAALQAKALEKGAQALADGNLAYRVNTADLHGPFRRHGENLNRINEGISRAVDARMRSERFKTELITNVSHDIKTPLTAIISYIDLLKKEELSGTKAAEYVEVLDRQSQRLKKLTEDIVEASKASTGAITVNPARTDAAELLQQALGEFSGQLEKSGITPVLTAPEEGVFIWADGRLLWRVFENLLQNICRYAQPGTRAYFDVALRGAAVEIAVKNVSAAPLNISADELMERFVRGDASRNSEGSGLGLSIARSLTELQGGNFGLQLDGDLFKVFIRFPPYREPEAPAQQA